MTEVEVPDFGVVEFPDDMSQDDITAALSKQFSKPLPKVTLSPYEQYKASGGEPVAGPFGPANPQEVLALPDVLKAPAAAIEKTGLMQSAEEIGADFLRRTGINPAAQAGEPLAPKREDETYIPTPFEEAFPNVGRGMEETVRGFTTPGTAFLAPFSGLKPVQAAFEAQMAAGVPEQAEAAFTAPTTEERTQVTSQAILGLLAGAHGILPKSTLEAAKTLERTPDASEVSKTTALHGNVQPQQTPPEELPKQEGGAGVQSQAQVGVPQAKPQVLLSESPPSGDAGEANRTAAGESGAVEPPVAAGGTPQAIPEGGTPQPVEQGGNVTHTVTEGLTGLGGALKEGEIGEGTGLKNAIGDSEREALGYEEATPTQKQAMDTSWALADQKLKQDPKSGDVIIQELKEDQSRGLTDVESATVLRHKVAVENALNDAAERTLTAKNPAEKAIAEQDHARLSDQLLEILNVAKERGRQWGLEGRWRQAIAKEDFSLAKMEADARIKRGGRQLYEDELAEVKRINERLQQQIKDLKEKQTKSTVTATEKATKETVEDVSKQAKETTPSVNPDEAITGLKDKLKAKVEKEETESIQPLLEQIAIQLYHKGIREQEPMIEALHGIVKEFIPGITKPEVLDALSGRGKFTLPSQEPVKVWLRDMKAQSRVAGHIEQLLKGDKNLPKTGPQRDKPTAAYRRIQNKLKDLMRQLGMRTIDPATQLASALSAVKTYTRNRIVDLKHAIETKQRLVKTKTPLAPDPELEGLRKELAEAQTEYESVFGKNQLSDEQRIVIAHKMLDRQISKLDEDITAGRIDRVKKITKTPETPELLEKRAWLQALKEYRQDLRDAKNPKLTPEERQLKMIKTRLASQTAKYQEKLTNGDFSTKKRIAPPEDRDVQVARANLEQTKQEWQKNLQRAELENASTMSRVGRMISRWRRESVLSGLHSVWKLTNAAAQGLILDPVQEAVGAAYGKVFPRFAERAKFEKPSSVAIEAKAFSSAFTHLLDDFTKTIKTGKSDLGFAYGGKNAIPEEMRAYFGSLHAALKTPLMRQAWTRANEVLAKQYLEEGIDITDPFVQMRIGTEAYKQAERKLFLEDNKVVSAYKRALSVVEPKNRPQTKGEAIASTAARVALPVVKIPTNLVARTFNAAFGTFTGGTRLAYAYAKGIENLPPEAADAIYRQLKAGSIGTAALLIGYFNADAFGGYYQPGEKHKSGTPKFGEVKLGGVTIPAYLQHRPELMAAQFGATLYKVAHSKIKQSDIQKAGLTEGMLAASLGLAEQAPFVGEMLSLGRLRQSKNMVGAAQGYTAGLLTPQLLQELAKSQDENAKGQIRKRDPHGMIQQLEVNLPYLRHDVPLAKKQQQ